MIDKIIYKATINGIAAKLNNHNNISDELISIIRSFPRTALHARLLSFRCNKSDEELSFEIPMPSDMENLVADIHRYT